MESWVEFLYFLLIFRKLIVLYSNSVSTKTIMLGTRHKCSKLPLAVRLVCGPRIPLQVWKGLSQQGCWLTTPPSLEAPWDPPALEARGSGERGRLEHSLLELMAFDLAVPGLWLKQLTWVFPGPFGSFPLRRTSPPGALWVRTTPSLP